MRTFKNICAQGDVIFLRRDSIPEDLTTEDKHKWSKGYDDTIIITHSETGHHHTMTIDREDGVPSVEMFTGDNPLISWLQVNRPTVLEHQRDFDTHEPIEFEKGIYEIRRQREYTAEGFRKAQD